MLWDGRTDDWHQGEHLANAIGRAGLDYDEMMAQVSTENGRIDAMIFANQEVQTAVGHGGVPLMVFDNEAFFRQDRIDLLLWRMKENCLTE